MVASAVGIDGSDLWLTAFLAASQPVAKRYFMVRDNNSAEGDPFQCSSWGTLAGVERPMPYSRRASRPDLHWRVPASSSWRTMVLPPLDVFLGDDPSQGVQHLLGYVSASNKCSLHSAG